MEAVTVVQPREDGGLGWAVVTGNLLMGWEWGQGGGDWFGQSIGSERTFGEGVWDLIMEVLGCQGLYLGGRESVG